MHPFAVAEADSIKFGSEWEDHQGDIWLCRDGVFGFRFRGEANAELTRVTPPRILDGYKQVALFTRLPDDQPSRVLAGRCLFCDRDVCLCDTATPDDQPSATFTRSPEAIEAARLDGVLVGSSSYRCGGCGDAIPDADVRVYFGGGHYHSRCIRVDGVAVHGTAFATACNCDDLLAARETIARLKSKGDNYNSVVNLLSEAAKERDSLRSQLTTANRAIGEAAAQLAEVTAERDALRARVESEHTARWDRTHDIVRMIISVNGYNMDTSELAQAAADLAHGPRVKP